MENYVNILIDDKDSNLDKLYRTVILSQIEFVKDFFEFILSPINNFNEKNYLEIFHFIELYLDKKQKDLPIEEKYYRIIMKETDVKKFEEIGTYFRHITDRIIRYIYYNANDGIPDFSIRNPPKSWEKDYNERILYYVCSFLCEIQPGISISSGVKLDTYSTIIKNLIIFYINDINLEKSNLSEMGKDILKQLKRSSIKHHFMKSGIEKTASFYKFI